MNDPLAFKDMTEDQLRQILVDGYNGKTAYSNFESAITEWQRRRKS